MPEPTEGRVLTADLCVPCNEGEHVACVAPCGCMSSRHDIVRPYRACQAHFDGTHPSPKTHTCERRENRAGEHLCPLCGLMWVAWSETTPARTSSADSGASRQEAES